MQVGEEVMRTGISRRDVLKGGAIVAVGGGALALEGCNTNWVQVALNDLPTLIQIATSIAGIVAAAEGGAISPALITQITNSANEVKSDLSTLQNIINQYNANPKANTGLLGDIEAGFNAVQDNLQGMLSAFHINNVALQTTITTALGLAVSMVMAIETLLPAPTTTTPAPAPTAIKSRARLAPHVNMRAAKSADTATQLHNVVVAVFTQLLNENGFSKYNQVTA